jgi:hypothetical protein
VIPLSVRVAVVLLILTVLSAHARAATTFNVGDVFARSSTGDIWNITAGGSYTAAAPFADIGFAGTGGLAFAADRSMMYVSNRDLNEVFAVTPTGVVSTFATGLAMPFGLLRAADGRLLVAELSTGEVTDITAGGNFPDAPAFATGLTMPANLAQTADGRIFVTESTAGEISDITAGGAIGTSAVFTAGLPNAYALHAAASGSGLIASDLISSTVYTISATGAATPYGTGRPVYSLDDAPDGHLLAAVSNTSRVYDISTPGGLTIAPEFATVPSVVNVAVVPVPEPASVVVFIVAGGALRNIGTLG